VLEKSIINQKCISNINERNFVRGLAAAYLGRQARYVQPDTRTGNEDVRISNKWIIRIINETDSEPKTSAFFVLAAGMCARKPSF